MSRRATQSASGADMSTDFYTSEADSFEDPFAIGKPYTVP
jgi:hypothetical protein